MGDPEHAVEDLERPPPDLGDLPPLLFRGDRLAHGTEQRLQRPEPLDLRDRWHGDRGRARRVEHPRAKIRELRPRRSDLVEQRVRGRPAGHLQFPCGVGEPDRQTGEPVGQGDEPLGEVGGGRCHRVKRF